MSEPNRPAPRRRFVIPFTGSPSAGSMPPPVTDGPAPTGARPAKSRGRGCLKFLIVGVVILLVVGLVAGVGGYFYWRNYQTQPGYSVALMFDAALNSDQKAFDEIVDSDKVSDDLSDQVTNKALAMYPGEVTDAMKQQIQKAVKDFLPTIKERAKKELIGEVAKQGEKLKGYPFPIMALAVPRVMQITQNGDSAKVVAPAQADSAELTMKRNGDRWQVIAVKDDAAVARILSAIMSELPTTDILKGKLPKNLPKSPRDLPRIPGLN
jgi:hypothetical protein